MLRECELKRSDCVLTVLSMTLKIEAGHSSGVRLKTTECYCLHNRIGRLVTMKTYVCIHTHTVHIIGNDLRHFALYRSQLLQKHL